MNVKKIEKYDMESLWFTDFAGEPERCWFAAGNMNGFFEANLITGEAIFLGRFLREKPWKKMLYQCCTKYRDKILFAPSMASSIAIYDIKKGELEEILLPECLLEQDTKFLFIVQYENICFLVGSAKPVIVCVNMLNNQIDYDFNILDRKTLSSVNVIIEGGHLWERDFVRKQNYFIMFSYKLGMYLKYDVEKKRAEQFVFLSGYCSSKGGVVAVKDNMYAYLRDKSKITYVKDQVVQDFFIDEEISRELKRFVKSYFIGESYYVFTDSNIIIKINFSDNQIKYIQVPKYNFEFIIEGNRAEFFRCIKFWGKGFVILHANGNLLIRYDENLEELAKQRIIPNNISMVELDYNNRYKGSIIQENSARSYVDVRYYIQLIESMHIDNKAEREANIIGEKVFQATKSYWRQV